MRLPDLVVMVHTRDKHQYREHPAIIDSAKVIVIDFNIFLTNLYFRLASQLLVWWTLTATPTLSPTQCLAMTIVRTLSKCSSTSPNRLLWRAKIRGSWNNSNNLLLMFPELGGFRDGKGNGGVVLKRKR